MEETDRIRLGGERKLIFENVANGVPVEVVMRAFRRSNLEVQQEVAFVARKIIEYRHRRCAEGARSATPPIACESYAEIRQNRKPLLETLNKLGPLYLSSELLLPKLRIAKVDSPDAASEVGHRMSMAR